jgi:integrase
MESTTLGTERVKLTQRTLDRAIASTRRDPAGGTRKLSCSELPGFSVSVHLRSVSYDFEYRMRGVDPATGRRPPTQTIRIGDTVSHALAEALEIGRELRAKVRRGIDPKQEQAAARLAAEQKRAALAAANEARASCREGLVLYQDVLATRGRSPRYQAEEVRHVLRGLTSVDALELTPDEITQPVIERVLGACPADSRSTRFGALSRFLTWASRSSGTLAATLLFDRHERPRPPPSRRRVLAGAEIAAIWRAVERLPNAVITDLAQLLVAVPCRRGEAATARWRDIDLGARIWHQPTSKSGNPHDFPLNDRALVILARRHEATGGHPDDYVFPGPRAGRPFCGWSNLIASIDARIPPAAPVPDWRLHDFRRSCVTHLAEQGHDETVLDLLLNHAASRSRGGVLGVYQRSQRWPERVAALAAWGELLGQYLGENVLSIRPSGHLAG